MSTQQQIAEYLDISPRYVRKLISDGVLPASKGKGGLDADSCRIAYIRYLRGINSGQVRENPEPESDDDDKSILDRIEIEKLRKLKRENDLEEGLYAPVTLLEDALDRSRNIIQPILESLPLIMKRNWPEMTGDQLMLVKRSTAECCNAIADSELKFDD